MRTFFYCSVSRRSLSDVFFGDAIDRMLIFRTADLDEITNKSPHGSDEVVALWSQDPQESLALPSVLLCSGGTGGDWTAWLTTYFAKLRPISAFVRLMEQAEFEGMVRRFRDPRLDSALWPTVGLIMGEVLASGISDRQLDTLPLNAYPRCAVAWKLSIERTILNVALDIKKCGC